MLFWAPLLRKICIQTFFGHIIFIKLLCECLATYESQLPTNPIPIVEADVLKIFDIRYFWEAYLYLLINEFF